MLGCAEPDQNRKHTPGWGFLHGGEGRHQPEAHRLPSALQPINEINQCHGQCHKGEVPGTLCNQEVL